MKGDIKDRRRSFWRDSFDFFLTKRERERERIELETTILGI